MFKKLALIALIAAAVVVFFYFDLNTYLSLEGMKASLSSFQASIAENPVLSVGVFFALYVAVTALSLPGAAILTLAAGALFGLWQGLIIVSFASSVGATLAFLVARFILRETVRQRFGEKLKSIDAGVEKQGAFYLFTLRLLPVFPFFLINLLMGLTSIKTFTFYWVSQVGMLAGTIVYVNAGTQLAQIDSLSGILSPDCSCHLFYWGYFPGLQKVLLRW